MIQNSGTTLVNRVKKYSFNGLWNYESWCDLEVWDTPKGRIAVVTEADDNPGTSVTNRIELLYATLRDEYGIDTLIEHYPARHGLQATWDLVQIGAEHQWQPVDIEDYVPEMYDTETD